MVTRAGGQRIEPVRLTGDTLTPSSEPTGADDQAFHPDCPLCQAGRPGAHTGLHRRLARQAVQRGEGDV